MRSVVGAVREPPLLFHRGALRFENQGSSLSVSAPLRFGVSVNLDEKLRQLKNASQPRDPDRELEQTLEFLRRMEKPPEPRKLPAQRMAKGIEEYVEGVLEKNDLGEYFVARQAFPFGRPYGKLRIGDISAADLLLRIARDEFHLKKLVSAPTDAPQIVQRMDKRNIQITKTQEP